MRGGRSAGGIDSALLSTGGGSCDKKWKLFRRGANDQWGDVKIFLGITPRLKVTYLGKGVIDRGGRALIEGGRTQRLS